MWIHILIFLIFCGLFFLSRGFFLKTGNYLAGKLPEQYKLTSGQIRLFLVIVFYGNLIGLAVTASESKEQELTSLIREEEPYTEELYVSNGEWTEKMTVEIGTEPYTEAEKQSILDGVIADLPQKILGENESFEKVEYPLQLITQYPDSEVILQWSTDQPQILDWEGMIGEDVPEEGTKVCVQADVLLDGYACTFATEVIVYPRKIADSGTFRLDVEQQLEEKNQERGTSMILPARSGDRELTWFRVNEHLGILIIGFSILVGGLWILSQKSREKESQEKKRKQMQEDYPGILNKLILLMQAGMSSRRAIQKMALDYKKDLAMNKSKRYAYEELLRMYRELEQGIPEEEVYRNMGSRCELICYRSLSTLLIQNLRKGSSYFLEALKKECTLAFEERKNRALIRGEEAGTKLLIPMVCMLLLVLLIILVPSMMTLG